MLYSHRFRQQVTKCSPGSRHSGSQSVRSHRGVTGITASGSAEDQIRLVNIRAWWALKMLGKCANPSCAASFRYLGEGMLFRLEPDPALRSSTPQTLEYYWLCPTCSTAMTLHINAQRTVVAAPLPAGIQGCCPDVEPMLVRQEGLLLRNVRCRSREPNEDRIADRPREAHHAS